MANVILRFLGDSAQLDRTFKHVASESEKMSGGLSRGFGLGVLSAAGAGLAIAKFAKDSVTQFRQAEDAQLRLSEAFRKFPTLADTNLQALRKLNTGLAHKTKFDDDAIASGQAVLAQFKLTGAQLKVATPLLLDYAAKTGKTLPDAASTLGKALLGNARALKEVGIKFVDLHDPTANLNEVMGALRDKVGGFAEREGKTAAGRAEILRNRFGELKETVGEQLVKAMDKLVVATVAVADWWNRLSPAAQTLAKVLGGVAAALVVLVEVTKVFTAVQAALDVVLAANPIGLVVVALAALGVALVVAWQHSQTFRDVVVGAIKFVVDQWLGMVGFFVDGAAKAFGWVPGIGPKLVEAARQFDAFRDSVNASLDGLRDHTVIVDMKASKGDARVVVGDAGAPDRPSRAPARAGGGPVNPYGAYVVGEHGPELLRMGSQGGTVIPNGAGGGGSQTINIYMPPGSSGEDVVAAIQRYERRNGRGWRTA